MIDGRFFALLSGLAVLTTPIAALAQGYQVQPMISEVTPSGSQSATRISIKNTGSVPITLEMEPFRVSVEEDGTPLRIAEEQDLLVFPPQSVVEPGKEQAVQVRYVGDASLAEARMYGVRVSQLPVNFGSGTGASGASADVRMSFNFLTHLIVSPSGATSELSVANTVPGSDGSLGVELRNAGNAIVIMNDYVWQVTDGAGKTASFTSDKVDLGGFSALMPNQTRRVIIPAEELQGLNGSLQVALQTP